MKKTTMTTIAAYIKNVPELAAEYAELQDDFFKFATAKGMVGIKGHRLVGGFRASCYNAMDLEGVQALVDCIKEYEALHA